MFLKSLILRGFKTFADQTEIEFSDDARITAIVGPNGCGKSNLMDATRWVIGEDNPRELRVGNLSNIIFAGTAARKSLSLAEVALVFDNSGGKLPVPFTEVVIKRRTFREGESEFYINKNSVRLKDIKDLLLDTGLGEATYSIITQGQVDAILSSKGEERRAVFEEAAGINKYKTRKTSAERKLISAEQNILRISDLKIEVAERIITLEAQAKVAREYLTIQQHIKQLDLNLSKKNLLNLLNRRLNLSKELAEVRQLSQAKKEVEQKDVDELASKKEALCQLEKEIDELLVKLDREKDHLRDIELDRRFAESEQQREEKAIHELIARQQSTNEKISELTTKMESESAHFHLSALPMAEELASLIEQAKQLIEQLASVLLQLGKEKALTLTIGGSAEREEAYQLKLELLKEEAKRLAEEKERVEFARQYQLDQLNILNNKLEQAKHQQSAVDLLSAKKKAKEELVIASNQLAEKLRQEDQQERQSLNEVAGLEVALAKIDTEISAIQDRISLEYNLSPAELTATPPEEIDQPTKAKKEIEEGKTRLRALEPVNLLAIEEFDKEKERLTFIEAQLADLGSARENLRGLIIELDQKAEQTFIETMTKLSQVFSVTFSKLFNGGEAKIELTPHLPPLEAEIEISVRSAGRKWLPLQLLSGGERSLSAIAILFSLLNIRPSPFVFMDEVDAALDDANIGRFASMLQDFSAHSQIIVITHNKRTMAVADSIYGVTMEEPGVSKVISMKLTEAAVV
jgi:chromosome segregation protein